MHGDHTSSSLCYLPDVSLLGVTVHTVLGGGEGGVPLQQAVQRVATFKGGRTGPLPVPVTAAPVTAASVTAASVTAESVLHSSASLLSQPMNHPATCSFDALLTAHFPLRGHNSLRFPPRSGPLR